MQLEPSRPQTRNNQPEGCFSSPKASLAPTHSWFWAAL